MNQTKKEWTTPTLAKHTRNSVDILSGTKSLVEDANDLGSN